MAITGYFFDGTTLGDAAQAPYSAIEVAAYVAQFGDFVIANYLNELEVTASGTAFGGLVVASGAAVVKGYMYENDAVATTSITSGDATNPRIDLVVLEVDDNPVGGQDVRINIVVGTAAASPSFPALAADQIAIAWVWIPAAFNAFTTLIDSGNVHDLRAFRPNNNLFNNATYANLMPNSEFMVFAGGTATRAPEGWEKVGSPTPLVDAAMFNEQPRGQSVSITGTTNLGIHAYIHLVGGYTYTLKFLASASAGGYAVSVKNVGGGTTYASTNVYPRAANEFILRFDLPADQTGIRLDILSLSAASTVAVGQILLAQGHMAGNFRPKHEIIHADYSLVDTSWNFSAKSTGQNVIELDVSFSNNFGEYARGAIVLLRGRDSGSAAGTAVMSTYHVNNATFDPISSLHLSGITNDDIEERTGFVPIDQGDVDSPFGIDITATGANTFDAQVIIAGLIT